MASRQLPERDDKQPVGSHRGRFISFEGIDGAGKSTHIDAFVRCLRARGIDVELSREPGGTPLGEKLRELLLSEPMSIETELLLMNAARREHLLRRIEPALAAGRWVVCDRFADSTWAYQGAGHGAEPDRIRWLEQWVQAGVQPDRTYLFDLPAAEAARRRASARAADRFEREDQVFFERVRDAYLQRAAQAPQRIVVLDASMPRERIAAILARDAQMLSQMFEKEA